jgi:hypothetical protein
MSVCRYADLAGEVAERDRDGLVASRVACW